MAQDCVNADKQILSQKKFEINSVKVIQAPLAGISDIVFRNLIRKYGSKCLLTTEMLSSEALNTCPEPNIAKFKEDEYPLSFQIVGHKPHLMAKAARLLEKKASSIDINFGCPVNKVVKSTDGCAMMKTPKLAQDIVKAVKDAVEIPVSAKFRLGWSIDSMNFIEFAQMLEAAGVDFVTLHARTRTQLYSGNADWEKIGQLKSALNIPVFANGDIKSVEDAKRCIELTKADGVSVGRGIMGDFTLPYRIEKFFETGVIIPEPSLEQKIQMLKEHLYEEMLKMGDPSGIGGIKFMRKFYGFYINGVRNASKYRQILVTIEKQEEIERILNEILDIHSAD